MQALVCILEITSLHVIFAWLEPSSSFSYVSPIMQLIIYFSSFICGASPTNPAYSAIYNCDQEHISSM